MNEYKIYVLNNYFYLEKNGVLLIEASKAFVKIKKYSQSLLHYRVVLNDGSYYSSELISFSQIKMQNGNPYSSQSDFETWYTLNTGKHSGGGNGNGVVGQEEKYRLISTNNYQVPVQDIHDGYTFVVLVDLNQSWNFILPESSLIRDDNKIYKTRIVIIGDGSESLNITINGGEAWTKGMTSIKLFRQGNDDVIVGALNNLSAGFSGWQREGSNDIICNATILSNTPINANTFTSFSFTGQTRQTNEAILNWNISNPDYIESKILQDCDIRYKISIDASTGGGTWDITAKIRVLRIQSNNTYIAEDIETSRASTGNFGGENQLISGFENVVLNAGDRIQLIYIENNLSGNFTNVVLSVNSTV